MDFKKLSSFIEKFDPKAAALTKVYGELVFYESTIKQLKFLTLDDSYSI